MGILDVIVSGFQVNLDKTYSFYGENMTANSKVYVNGEKQKTQFLNNTRIELKECELQEGDLIVINQVGSSNRVFRSSEEFVYSVGKLVPAAEYVPPVEEPSQEEIPEEDDILEEGADDAAYDNWEVPAGEEELEQQTEQQ